MKGLCRVLGLAVLVLCVANAQQTSATPAPQSSGDLAAMEQRMRDLEDRVITLEGQLRQLKAQGGTTAPPATPPSAPTVQTSSTTEQGAAGSAAQVEEPRLGGAGAAASKALNPDVSVIGDFISGAGRNPFVRTPSFEMHESEIGLQAIVDPYARADFFISFGEQGVNLEEGFITFTALPKNFVAKAGKMRAPGPKDWFLEATGQVYRGDSADVFTATNKNDLSVVGHFRAYRDLTENSNIDLGGSYSRGHNLFGSDFVTNLYGVDATFRWKPLQRAIYRSFVMRSEFIWRQQQQPSLVACVIVTCPASIAPGFQRAFGFYTSGDYQFARRWFAGARVDSADRPFNARLNDKGGSLVLTYWPSEFAQIRGQYRFTRYAQNIDAHELFMQVQFALGAHGAHPF